MKNKLILGLVATTVIALGALTSTALLLTKDNNKQQSEAISSENPINLPVDNDTYQGLFLKSGQVYFGKLSQQDNNTFKLTKVYYLKEDSGKLHRLGDEQHRPQDAMYIPRESVDFWENLQEGAFEGQLK